jgi:ubiquinone/menaquinone biosynthesis C-methylase UbiE
MPTGTALIDPSKIFEKIGITAGQRVADFGCGRTGHVVFPLSPMVGERGVVYALDILKDVLESVKSQAHSGGFENVHAVWTDLEAVGAAPIPAESIDAGFFMNVMFMMKKRPDALREAARLIKSEGFLAVVDWSRKLGPLGPLPAQMINQNELAATAQNEGFDLVDNFAVGDYHFCSIFKKR